MKRSECLKYSSILCCLVQHNNEIANAKCVYENKVVFEYNESRSLATDTKIIRVRLFLNNSNTFMFWKRCSFIRKCIFSKKQKSHGTKSGEYRDWLTVKMRFLSVYWWNGSLSCNKRQFPSLLHTWRIRTALTEWSSGTNSLWANRISKSTLWLLQT